MTRHAIDADTVPDGGGVFTLIDAYVAFCTAECGWEGDWHHLDNYDPDNGDPMDQAYADAKHDGVLHLHQEEQPSEDRPALPGMGPRTCTLCGELEGSEWASKECVYGEVAE